MFINNVRSTILLVCPTQYDMWIEIFKITTCSWSYWCGLLKIFSSVLPVPSLSNSSCLHLYKEGTTHLIIVNENCFGQETVGGTLIFIPMVFLRSYEWSRQSPYIEELILFHYLVMTADISLLIYSSVFQ